MIGGIPVAQLVTLGPWHIVTLTVLLVLFGVLVPRWLHQQRIQDRDKHIALLERTLEKREEQFTQLIKNDELVIKLLEDLREASKRQ